MMPIGSRRRRKRRSHRRRLLDQPSSTEPAFVDHQQGEGALCAINTSASSSVSSSSSSFSAQSSSLLQVVPESNVFVKKSAASSNPDGIHLFLANSSCSTSATTTLNESWEQELSAPIESSASLGPENFVSTSSSSSHYGIVSSVPSTGSSRIQELHYGDRFAMGTEFTFFENGSKSGKKGNLTYKKMQPCLQIKSLSTLHGHRRTIRRRGEFFRYHNRRKFQKVIVVTTSTTGGTQRRNENRQTNNNDDNLARQITPSVPRFPMLFLFTSVLFLLCVYFPGVTNTLAESSIKGFHWIQRYCVEPILLLPNPDSTWSNEEAIQYWSKRSRRHNYRNSMKKPIRISRGGRAGIVY